MPKFIDLRKPKGLYLIAIFCLLLIQNAFTQEEMQYSLDYTEGGRFVSQINEGRITVQYDESQKQWDVIYSTDSYEYSYKASDDFSLLYYQGTYSDPTFIEYLRGYEEKEIIRQENGAYLFRFKKRYGREREREIPPIDWAIASETTLVYFQMQLNDWNKGIADDEVTCFLPPYPVTDMEYTIERVRVNTLHDETNIFDLPGFFQDFLDSDKEVILVTGSLKGFAYAIQPFPFYFAYETEAPYLPVAAWGGIPNKEDYFAVYYSAQE